MKRRVLFYALLCGLIAVGISARLRLANGQTTIQDTAAAPPVTFTPDTILHFWSAQALTRGVSNDTQWAAAMAQIFSTTTFPGADPTALAFLRSFFVQYVHVGP